MSDAIYRRVRHMMLKRAEAETGLICKWDGRFIVGFDRDLEEWVRI